MSEHEQRAYPRRSTEHLQAWFKLYQGLPKQRCRILDASATGAFIETDLFLPEGTSIEFTLEFLGENKRPDLFVRTARVVRRTHDGVGVAFAERM